MKEGKRKWDSNPGHSALLSEMRPPAVNHPFPSKFDLGEINVEDDFYFKL